MTAREKVISAESQVRAIINRSGFPCPECDGVGTVRRKRGDCVCAQCQGSGAVALAGIECPFCGEVSTPENGLLCCELLADVVNAFLDTRDVQKQMDVVEGVYQRLVEAETHGILN